MANIKTDRDDLLLDQYQKLIRNLIDDRKIENLWSWDDTLKKFYYDPPEKLGIPEPEMEKVYEDAENLLKFTFEQEKTPIKTQISIKKLGKDFVNPKEPKVQPPAALAARRMAHILLAHPESDFILRAECKTENDDKIETSFQVGSNSLSEASLASMIRGAYGRVDYELVRVSPKYTITCYAKGSSVVRNKQIFEQLEKEPPTLESWVNTLLAALSCEKNYDVEFRFHPLLSNIEKKKLLELINETEKIFQELAFYSDVTWNNGINGGGNLSFKISGLKEKARNLDPRKMFYDSGTEQENYSFSYSKSSKNVDQHAVSLMTELEWYLIRLRRMYNSNAWNVTISASASDQETLDAITAIISGTAERANFSLKWDQEPCSTLLASSQELLPFLTFPTIEFAGFEFVENEEFSLLSPGTEENSLNIGNILWNGTQISQFYLPQEKLNRHTFICGMTGAGKTNTLFEIIENISVPFLVIEPVKGEYRALAGVYPNTKIWTMRTSEATSENVDVLQLNPFWFPKGSNLAFHIDSIKTIISSAFDLDAAMPNIVEQCLYNVYIKSGWNIVTNRNIYDDILPELYLYPTFQDFTNEVADYLEKSEYGEEVKGNYKGALLSRLRSFTNGSKGVLLNTSKHPDYKSIMNGRCIMELEGLADDADKCLVMGTILVQYYQYLKCNFHDSDKSKNLKHIIVIEEAHRLFKNIKPKSRGAEGPDPTGQLVENLSNIMAEIRAFGEGMLIVDQSPTKIAEDVIKNSSTKIIHRIDHGEDIKLLQSAMLMPENQIGFSSLSQGEALIRTDEMLRPCKVKIHRSNKKNNYSLAKSFQTNQLISSDISDEFIANSILQDDEIYDNIRLIIKKFLYSLVWMNWNEWYDVTETFILNVMIILFSYNILDRIEGRFRVLSEIISIAIKRMYSCEGTKTIGFIHMFIMRLLDFYYDRKKHRKVKDESIKMMYVYFCENLYGEVLFPKMRNILKTPEFYVFSQSVGLEDEKERAYLLFSYFCDVIGEMDKNSVFSPDQLSGKGLEDFFNENTFLFWENYKDQFKSLNDNFQFFIYDKFFISKFL